MPMMTISISREGESAEPQQGMDPTVARKPSELSAGKVAMISASAHQSISLIRQGLSNAVNNYGNVTGDYTRQKNMQKALGVANDMATLSTKGEGLRIEANAEAKVLVLSGEPIDEPVIGYGPFVMNTPQEINEAIDAFNRGEFGRM